MPEGVGRDVVGFADTAAGDLADELRDMIYRGEKGQKRRDTPPEEP